MKTTHKTDFSIARLGVGDLVALNELITLFHNAFETQGTGRLSDAYGSTLLADNHVIIAVAKFNDEVVGGLTAYELPSCYGPYSEAYLYDFAVRDEWRRHGAGRSLITWLMQYCASNYIRTFFVEAHEQDKPAIDFYSSTNGSAEKVVHFNFDPDASMKPSGH
jgi:aminoglycoside 3-N-acetyltransferase I